MQEALTAAVNAGFAQRCSESFLSNDWQRGQAYYRAGAVTILGAYEGLLVAEVRGSRPRPYSVFIELSRAEEEELPVFCTCPRFDDEGACKHVAAALFAAEVQWPAELAPGNHELYLVPLYEAPTIDGDVVGHGDAVGHGRRARRKIASPAPPPVPNWQQRLTTVSNAASGAALNARAPGGRSSKPRQIWYLLDIHQSRAKGKPVIKLRQRAIKKDGSPGVLKDAQISLDDVPALSLPEDRELLEMLAGNSWTNSDGYSYMSYYRLSTIAIVPSLYEVILPRLCATGRFGWQPTDRGQNDEVHALSWDDGPAWKPAIKVAKTSDEADWELSASLARDESEMSLASAVLLLESGLAVFPDRVARLDVGDQLPWLRLLQSGPLVVPRSDEQALIERIVQLPSQPAVAWPPELRWGEESPTPQPRLRIAKPKRSWQTELECHLSFAYGEQTGLYEQGPAAWYARAARRAVRRDFGAERHAFRQLLGAGASQRQRYGYETPGVCYLKPERMPKLVQQLVAAGWEVEAEGQLIRRPGAVAISVTSGVDWFDLEGDCDFGGVTASLPQLLAALRRGETFIALDDGSQGMLPEEWLARYGALAELGESEGDRLRFRPTQAALLDALLAAHESDRESADKVSVDKAFDKLRQRLRSFDGIKPRNAPRGFVGELRPYQREGLGWLRFLDEFGFGGCLADDMGLGKTVQVLAMLAERRRARSAANGKQAKNGAAAPHLSLVVVPRSLVFNWIEEARRFTPKLRVCNYTGLDRANAWDALHEYDVVVTTYGTLRRDIALLTKVEFDYVILDEAQAIKNSASQSAKCTRLLNARRRLAMTGTPVENHLGELWSLFEFLNPGMLGRSPKLHELFAAGGRGRAGQGVGADTKEVEKPAESLALLARTLRPFMLRRTKSQVLSELPAKTEQTLYCELDTTQRKAYQELRDHYRSSLLERVQKVGVNKSKIHVLEALLRLRQAACHPGLIDKKKANGGSAKLETLLEQLSEVIDEGHKALVFSQFTSLLAIVRAELDQRKIVYEYLDGRTAKRQPKVERFQTDPDCRAFLISLKAGGQGLNLTAADYVFILDPWWNPAVEAQAVDRAHRIGQERHVFAYRLIARDTVEEKILQLQDQKRGLAEAIVTADSSLLRNLTAEDLQLLLS